jgi:orotate phosphoribosyltransferase
VVTSRLEKYRSETEQWLSDHQVEYSELVMLDEPDADTRRRERLHVKHKADFYARSGTDLFIESDYAQAVQIAARSGRQVFAIDRREMVYPTPARALMAAPGSLARSVARPPAMILTEQARRIASRIARLPLVARVRRALRRR